MDKSAEEEMELIFRRSMQMVEHLLRKFGEFLPFSVYLNLNGKANYLNAFDGNERPKRWEVVIQLENYYKKEFKRYKAVGIVFDVKYTLKNGKKTDAVVISTHHSNKTSLNYYVPYKIKDEEVILEKRVKKRVDHFIYL